MVVRMIFLILSFGSLAHTTIGSELPPKRNGFVDSRMCQHCDTVFFGERYLIAHLKARETFLRSDKQKTCEYCSDLGVFCNQNAIQQHKKALHAVEMQKTFPCDVCPTASFRFECHFKKHQQTRKHQDHLKSVAAQGLVSLQDSLPVSTSAK